MNVAQCVNSSISFSSLYYSVNNNIYLTRFLNNISKKNICLANFVRQEEKHNSPSAFAGEASEIVECEVAPCPGKSC